MTLLLAEGFGWITPGDYQWDVAPFWLGSGQWAGNSKDFTIAAYATGRCTYHRDDTSSTRLRTGGLGNNSQINLGMRLVTSVSYATVGMLNQFFDGGDTLGSWGFETDGKLYYSTTGRVGGGGAVIIAQSSQALSGPGENYVELEVVFHGSAGTVKMWIDGVLVCDESGLDSIGAGSLCDSISFEGTAGFESWPTGLGCTDIYIDSSTQHGDIKVQSVACTVAGSESDWTPDASTNISMVDEIGPDEDTTFNSSAVTGDRDGYKCAAISDVGDIIGIVHQVRVRKEDAFAGFFKIGCLYSGSEDQSSDKSTSLAYAMGAEIFETNPDTAAAFLAAQLTSVELTIENTS